MYVCGEYVGVCWCMLSVCMYACMLEVCWSVIHWMYGESECVVKGPLQRAVPLYTKPKMTIPG